MVSVDKHLLLSQYIGHYRLYCSSFGNCTNTKINKKKRIYKKKRELSCHQFIAICTLKMINSEQDQLV